MKYFVKETAMTDEYIALKNHLKTLGLYQFNEYFASEAKRAEKENLSYIDYLSRLVTNQIEAKQERSINYKITNARFPFIKELTNFDFSFQPSLSKKQINSLTSLDFIKKAENILFIGPPGVGKTHLAIGLGILACKCKVRTLYISAKDLIDNLLMANHTNTLIKELEKYSRMPLLIIDELGFLPISKEGANLFFQLISKKYEHTSIIITSNKSFADWGDIFDDDVIAAAIIDRLVHHSHIFKITGKSYRVREKIEAKEDKELVEV